MFNSSMNKYAHYEAKLLIQQSFKNKSNVTNKIPFTTEVGNNALISIK